MGNAPTVYEVARLADVSTASVSRVLAGNDRVRADIRERVLAAVSELGYVQSGAARDLARKRTSTFALCFPDPGVADEQREASLWYDEVIRGMERAARLAGYMLLIAATHDDGPGIPMARTVSSRCDGMVAMSTPAAEEELRHIARHTPLVLVGSTELHAPRVDHLHVANAEGTYLLTRHLLDEHGVHRPAFVAGADSPDSDERFAGYRRALSEHGMAAPDVPDAVGDFTTGGGYLASRELLARRTDCDALVCVNDQTAMGTAAALKDTGRRIGHDVAVTGFDGIVLARAIDPPLTTVLQPMRELGERAIDLLVRRAGEPDAEPTTVELPVTLRLGGSCGCPIGLDVAGVPERAHLVANRTGR